MYERLSGDLADMATNLESCEADDISGHSTQTYI